MVVIVTVGDSVELSSSSFRPDLIPTPLLLLLEWPFAKLSACTLLFFDVVFELAAKFDDSDNFLLGVFLSDMLCFQ